MTLQLHKDGVVLCDGASVRAILSSKVVWAAENDTEVAEKERDCIHNGEKNPE